MIKYDQKNNTWRRRCWAEHRRYMVLILILSALIFNLYVLTLIIFWKKKADLWNIQRPVSTSASDRWVKWGFFFFWVQICERLIGKDQPPLILSLRGNLKSISLVRMSICLPNSTILAFLSRLVIARNWSSTDMVGLACNGWNLPLPVGAWVLCSQEDG